MLAIDFIINNWVMLLKAPFKNNFDKFIYEQLFT